MKVFQIGAAGGVGQRLAALLVADGHQVTGMVRRPDQSGTVAATGAEVVAETSSRARSTSWPP